MSASGVLIRKSPPRRDRRGDRFLEGYSKSDKRGDVRAGRRVSWALRSSMLVFGGGSALTPRFVASSRRAAPPRQETWLGCRLPNLGSVWTSSLHRDQHQQAASIGGHGDDSERLPIQSWNVGGTWRFPFERKPDTLWVKRPLIAPTIPQAVTDHGAGTWSPSQRAWRRSGEKSRRWTRGLLMGSLQQADIGAKTCKKAGPEPFERPLKLPKVDREFCFWGACKRIPHGSRPHQDRYPRYARLAAIGLLPFVMF